MRTSNYDFTHIIIIKNKKQKKREGLKGDILKNFD